MSDETLPTAPRPFIFVLMPFHKDFDDIYFSGIKDTANGVGAYAERVDEQNYSEGIFERIFNQINKADVIVADMTGRNPNVFYEVGYAHALGKIVLLLTQNADDIPFDLKHRPHIVYGTDGGKIKNLCNQLSPKLTWAINESKRERKVEEHKRILVSVLSYESKVKGFVEIEEDRFSESVPTIDLNLNYYSQYKNASIEFSLSFHIYNISSEEIPTITHIYSFATVNPVIITDQSHYSNKHQNVKYVYNPEKDGKFQHKYSLNTTISPIPPNATDAFDIRYSIYFANLPGYKERESNSYEIKPELNKLRIHIQNNYYDFPFLLKVTITDVKT